MKRFLAIALLLCVCLSTLSGCKKNKYQPVESTAEESRVILSLTVGENNYDVRYELYRAFFLTYKSEIDGGDNSVWSSENKNEYINRINEKIVTEAAKIFAVVPKVAAAIKEELGCDGMNILQNNGVEAGQTVFHLHNQEVPT